MKWKGWNGLLLFVAVAVAGCAGVNLYTDKELEHKTGVPFYMAKPYLLVKRTGSTQQPVSVDVIYLPDLENPLYARQRVGVGKSKFTVKLTDGKLGEFSTDIDSKATEFTEAVTTGLKTLVEAFEIQQEADRDRAQAALARETQEIAGQLNGMADEFAEAAAGMTGGDKVAAQQTSDALRSQAVWLRATTGKEEQVAAALEELLKDRGLTDEAKQELRRTIARLRAMARVAAAVASTFELYEIRMKDGQTTLVPVKLPQPPATGGARAPTSAG